MELKSLAGNPRIRQMLENRREDLPHACILSGPVGSGRHTLGKLLCAAMVCQHEARSSSPCGSCSACKKVFAGIHPDVNIMTGPGEGKPITVDQIRSLRSDAYIRPNEGRRKVYLLENAGDMRPEAQNAMLKLLEEGPEYAAFLLLCENPGSILQTIRSRCEQLPLSPVSPVECEDFLRKKFPDRGQEEIRTAAFNCQGILGTAVAELEGDGTEGNELRRQAAQLAHVLCEGDELSVLEASMPLEKLSREQWSTMLSRLEVELVDRLAGRRGDPRRTLRCIELCKQLRGANSLNTNPGQMAGWLCAAIFE